MNTLGPLNKKHKSKDIEILSLKFFIESHLNDMVGMNYVKSYINNMIDRLYVQELRRQYGFKNIPFELNFIFEGNPGTGKTTIARLIAEILYRMNILESNHTIEVTRKDLVAQHIGATAIKTYAVIEKARGGVLFIDEAYSLDSSSRNNDFGSEAIETLMTEMENSKGEFVVIIAGYLDKIEDFLNSNPGLKSRFSQRIKFKDYSSSELFKIIDNILKDHNYTLNDDADVFLKKILSLKKVKDVLSSSNGRAMRQLADKVSEEQAIRIVKQNIPASELTLSQLSKNDIKKAFIKTLRILKSSNKE